MMCTILSIKDFITSQNIADIVKIVVAGPLVIFLFLLFYLIRPILSRSVQIDRMHIVLISMFIVVSLIYALVVFKWAMFERKTIVEEIKYVTIHGIVRDQNDSNNPAEGVFVYCEEESANFKFTNNDGSFSLKLIKQEDSSYTLCLKKDSKRFSEMVITSLDDFEVGTLTFPFNPESITYEFIYKGIVEDPSGTVLSHERFTLEMEGQIYTVTNGRFEIKRFLQEDKSDDGVHLNIHSDNYEFVGNQRFVDNLTSRIRVNPKTP